MRQNVPRLRRSVHEGTAQRNMQSLMSHPRLAGQATPQIAPTGYEPAGRMQGTLPRYAHSLPTTNELPGAAAHQSAGQTTARYAAGMDYTGNRAAPPTGNSLNLARVPTIPGEGATSSVAYRPGVPGSSPFVSDGPLSGGPRSPELQARLDAMKKNLGLGINRGSQNIPEHRTALGTVYQETDDGGIRLVGPQAQQHIEQERAAGRNVDVGTLIGERRRLMRGIPTTIQGDEVVARREYQQPSLNRGLTRMRQGYADSRGVPFVPGESVRDMRAQAPGRGGSGVVPEVQSSPLTEEQRSVVQGAFSPVADANGQPVARPPGESLRAMFLSEEFQSNPAAAAEALRHQMTRDDFMAELEDAYGFLGMGQESPDLVNWLQEVGAALGYDVAPGPTDFVSLVPRIRELVKRNQDRESGGRITVPKKEIAGSLPFRLFGE